MLSKSILSLAILLAASLVVTAPVDSDVSVGANSENAKGDTTWLQTKRSVEFDTDAGASNGTNGFYWERDEEEVKKEDTEVETDPAFANGSDGTHWVRDVEETKNVEVSVDAALGNGSGSGTIWYREQEEEVEKEVELDFDAANGNRSDGSVWAREEQQVN